MKSLEASINKNKTERLKVDVLEKDVTKKDNKIEKLDKKIEEKEAKLKNLKQEKENKEIEKLREEIKNTEPVQEKKIDDKDVDVHKKHMTEKGFGSLVDNLNTIDGFDKLTDGQKMLVAEGMNQTLLKHIENEAQKRFMEEVAPYQTKGFWSTFSKKGMTGLWKNMTKGTRVAKHAKESLRELKSTDSAHEKKREEFLKNNVLELVKVYGESKLDAHLGGKDGKELVVDYAKFEGNDPEVKKITEIFNEVASNPPPYEWGLKDADKKQKKAYAEYETKFNATKALYTEKLKDYVEKNKNEAEYKGKITSTVEDYVAQELCKTDVDMKIQQYLVTNPEASRELRDVAEKNPLWKSVKSGIKKHGPIVFIGYEMRNVLRGLNFITPGAGEVAVAALGAGIGIYKGGKRGEEAVREKNKLLRSGLTVKDSNPETKKLLVEMNNKEAVLEIEIAKADTKKRKETLAKGKEEGLTYAEKVAIRNTDPEYVKINEALAKKLEAAKDKGDGKNKKLTGIKKDIQETQKELEELNKKGEAGTSKFKNIEEKLILLSEEERLERESKQTNAAVGKAERHINRISKTQKEFNDEKDPAKKAELLSKLKMYVDVAETKLALGEVNFGQDNRFYKQYEITKNIADAKILMETQLLSDADLQKIFGSDKDILKDNMFAENIENSEFSSDLAKKVQRRGIRENERAEKAQQNLINEYRRNGAYMGAAAALLGSGVRLGMEELTGHASTALTGMDFIKHQADVLEHAITHPIDSAVELAAGAYTIGEHLAGGAENIVEKTVSAIMNPIDTAVAIGTSAEDIAKHAWSIGKDAIEASEHPHETLSKIILAVQEKVHHAGAAKGVMGQPDASNVHYNDDGNYTEPNARNIQSKIVSRVGYEGGDHVDPKTGQIIRDYGHKGVTTPTNHTGTHNGVHKAKKIIGNVQQKETVSTYPTTQNLEKHLNTPNTTVKAPTITKIPVSEYHLSPDEVAKIHQAKDALVKNSLNTYFPKHGFLGGHGINSTEWKDASDLKAEDFLKQTDIDAKSPLANMQGDINKFVKELGFRKPIPGESLEHYYGDLQEARVEKIIVVADTEGLPATDDGSLDSTRVGRRMARIDRKMDLNGTHSSIWKEIKNDSAKDFLEKEPIIDPKDPTTIAKNDLWKDMKLAMTETKEKIPTDMNVTVNEYLKHLETVKAEAFAEQGGVDDQIKDLINGKDITATNYDDIGVDKEVAKPTVIQNNNISIKHTGPLGPEHDVEPVKTGPIIVEEKEFVGPPAPKDDYIEHLKTAPLHENTIDQTTPEKIRTVNVPKFDESTIKNTGPLSKFSIDPKDISAEDKATADNIMKHSFKGREIHEIHKNAANAFDLEQKNIVGENGDIHSLNKIIKHETMDEFLAKDEADMSPEEIKLRDYLRTESSKYANFDHVHTGPSSNMPGDNINPDFMKEHTPSSLNTNHTVQKYWKNLDELKARTEMYNNVTSKIDVTNNVTPTPEITHATEPLGPELPKDYNNVEPAKKLVPNFTQQSNDLIDQQHTTIKPSSEIPEKPTFGRLVYSEKKIDKILNHHFKPEIMKNIRLDSDKKFHDILDNIAKSDPKNYGNFLTKDVKSFINENYDNNPVLKKTQTMVKEYLNRFPNLSDKANALDRLGENMRVTDFLHNAELIQEKINHLGKHFEK